MSVGGRASRVASEVTGEAAASRLSEVELVPEVTALARSLLKRHPLRAAGAIQLASCLYLDEHLSERIPFVAFDRRLRTAARAERLRVLPARIRPTR